MTSPRPRLACIGVGLMGGPMAARLVALGYPLCAFDIEASRLAVAISGGVTVAVTARHAIKGAEIILLNLPSESAVESVVEAIAKDLTGSQLIVDFSTVSPDFSQRMSERVKKDSGRWIDAPVSGGPSASGSGALTIMAGGTSEAIERVRPLMADIGRQFTHAGDVGMGSAAKTVAQLIVGTNYAVLAEAVHLAESIGLDAALLPECVRHGHADGVLMQQIYPRIVDHDFAPRAYARQLLKDLEAVQDIARASQAATPMSGQATQLFRLLIAAGHGDIDGAGIYRLYEGATANVRENERVG
jgi:3-hydroxyisobutyrate dehydrogenase